jgi:hypothetical protein
MKNKLIYGLISIIQLGPIPDLVETFERSRSQRRAELLIDPADCGWLLRSLMSRAALQILFSSKCFDPPLAAPIIDPPHLS